MFKMSEAMQTSRRITSHKPGKPSGGQINLASFLLFIVYSNHHMSTTTKLLTIFAFIVIILNIWGALYPSHYNWGNQTFAFYPPAIGIAALIVALALLIPRIQRFVARGIDRITKPLSKLPVPILFIGALGLLVLLAFTFPVKGLLLGDSKIILLTTPELPSSTEESANFRNQPLVLLTLRFLEGIVQQGGTQGLKEIYKWFDIIGGAIFLLFVFIFIRHLQTSRTESLLLGLFILSASGIQLFFGYIENYALLYAVTAGFFVSGWLAINGKLHPVIPLLLMIMMMGLHLGAIIYLPALMLLFALSYRRNRLSILILTGIAVVVVILVFVATDYSLNQFLIRMRDAFRYDILPFFQLVPGIPYTVFSPLHLIAWLNLVMLAAPLGLLPLIILYALRYTALRSSLPEILFLTVTTLCGLLFTFVIHPALGMFRDWDMLSSFLVPLIFFTAFAFARRLTEPEKRHILVMITGLSIIHGVFFIGINTDEDRHLKRAEVLADPLFLGHFAQKLLYERLANITWERKEYQRSRYWHERYLALDSTNPRIVANLSGVYSKLNDSENEFRMLKRSVELGSMNPSVYSNVGIKYFKNNDIDKAISAFQSALALDPFHAISRANIGLCYTLKKKHSDAVRHLEIAYRLGMRDPPIVSAIGDNYLALKNIPKAIDYYRIYMRIQPADTVIQKRLRELEDIRKLK